MAKLITKKRTKLKGEKKTAGDKNKSISPKPIALLIIRAFDLFRIEKYICNTINWKSNIKVFIPKSKITSTNREFDMRSTHDKINRNKNNHQYTALCLKSK